MTVRHDGTARDGQARRRRGRSAFMRRVAARAAVAAAAWIALTTASSFVGGLWGSIGLGDSSAEAAHAAVLPDHAIRFHVVGHSDDVEDQRVKLVVRDALLPELERLAHEHGGWAAVPWERSLSRLEMLADAVLRQHGFTYGARAVWQGEPAALRVLLGEGAGANWWCVLFPPLCFVDVAPGLEMVAGGLADAASRPEGELREHGADEPALSGDGGDGSRLRLGLRAWAAFEQWREEEGWANWSTSLFGQSTAQGAPEEEP